MNECSDSDIKVEYGGELHELIQGDIGDWDAVIVVHYPSRRHAIEMFRSDTYQGINPLAEAALEKRVLWSSKPAFPDRTQPVEFNGGRWMRLLQDMSGWVRLTRDYDPWSSY